MAQALPTPTEGKRKPAPSCRLWLCRDPSCTLLAWQWDVSLKCMILDVGCSTTSNIKECMACPCPTPSEVLGGGAGCSLPIDWGFKTLRPLPSILLAQPRRNHLSATGNCRRVAGRLAQLVKLYCEDNTVNWHYHNEYFVAGKGDSSGLLRLLAPNVSSLFYLLRRRKNVTFEDSCSTLNWTPTLSSNNNDAVLHRIRPWQSGDRW